MAKANVSEKNRDIHDRGHFTSVERGDIWRLIEVITRLNAVEAEVEDEFVDSIYNGVDDDETPDLIELHDQIND